MIQYRLAEYEDGTIVLQRFENEEWKACLCPSAKISLEPEQADIVCGSWCPLFAWEKEKQLTIHCGAGRTFDLVEFQKEESKQSEVDFV